MDAKPIRGILLLAALLPAVAAGVDSVPHLSVIFGEREVALSGTIDSEETGTEIANSIKAVRPDLSVANAGLTIDPEATIPDKRQILSILSELGLSTHEGRLEIREDSVLVGGLTDSLVTTTALNLKTEPILNGRNLINRVCIVATEDLPDITVKLASGETAKTVLDFDIHPSAEEAFEAPGLPVEKLFPTLVMLSDFSRLESRPQLAAEPVDGEPAEEPETSPARLILAQPIPEPEPEIIEFESIRFSRNTFFLQANQQQIVTETAKRLQSPDIAELPIKLVAMKASSGSGAFNEYTSERRLAEASRLLKDLGVSEDRFVTKIRDSESTIDTGEVKVLVELPLPEPEEEAESEEKPEVAVSEEETEGAL